MLQCPVYIFGLFQISQNWNFYYFAKTERVISQKWQHWIYFHQTPFMPTNLINKTIVSLNTISSNRFCYLNWLGHCAAHLRNRIKYSGTKISSWNHCGLNFLGNSFVNCIHWPFTLEIIFLDPMQQIHSGTVTNLRWKIIQWEKASQGV